MNPIYLLWLITGLMAVAMAYAINLSRRADNIMNKFFVYLILGMMNSMLIAPVFYFIFILSLLKTIEFSVIIMMLEVLPFLFKFLSDLMQNSGSVKKSFLFYYTIFFVIFDELIMSIDFNLITANSYLHFLFLQPLNAVFQAVSTYWFVFPMAFEMLITSLILKNSLKKLVFIIFAMQSLVMLLMPTAINNSLYARVAVYLSGAIMTGFFIYIFEYLYRKQSLHKTEGKYILQLLGAYTLMMAGVFIWQYSKNVYLISASMIIDMIVYLNGLLRYNFDDKQFFWITARRWSVLYMTMVFTSEFFMGLTFDAQYYGAGTYLISMGLALIGGSIINIISASLYDFIVFFADVALSPWFLIMMGIEMGSLVVFKIRTTKQIENKIRLILMLLAYALYTVIVPSFLIPNNSMIPFIGWTMGIGSGGPVAPLLIIPMVLTYVISGILSLLFGSRQLCSVFCSAPVMYQGTFYDSMKKFNRQTKTSRAITLNNKSGQRLYKTVSLIVYASIGITAVLSFLDSIHITSFYFYGTDPEYMLYLFYFGVVWYIVFITMPLLGSYACINTGYCHWGNFNRFVSRFGFFKLKVRDSDTCLTCKTRDCATACPVGNSAMPGSFIKTGAYKDSRCVGIGDCIEACPHDNIFVYDVRNYLRERLGGEKKKDTSGSKKDKLI
ncbi:4Fe-4S binding protein [Acidiplasma aeolicum]|uniref:4Fe-4S binding protein n=1 Tax=Acidiplasma aeolicum TaxID=507754 RepID=UPI0006D57151|nr:4Fe-4S dicluster domain-containing protein [Acidiplasma aeolicum]